MRVLISPFFDVSVKVILQVSLHYVKADRVTDPARCAAETEHIPLLPLQGRGVQVLLHDLPLLGLLLGRQRLGVRRDLLGIEQASERVGLAGISIWM